MREPSRGLVATILFTDLVGSTELMQRVGDERARGIFAAHHQLLSDTVAAHGGSELQWLGDGLMVTFGSTADAVRCAVAMQQAATQRAESERLQIRVGLNAGEILRQEIGSGSGYFGTPVVTARRLCDLAEAGQILCGQTIAGLLAGRSAFAFRALGAVTLKGLAQKLDICEVVYEAERPEALLVRTPFVGRPAERSRLEALLERARSGEGALAFVVGEPGIGKTRLLEEAAASGRAQGALVLWGRCVEGEYAPPFAPFAEALAGFVRATDAAELAQGFGAHARVLAKLVPELRERIPDLPHAEPLQPDEERHRLLDAVAQVLWSLAQRAPVLLVLDDLHWADAASLALLRHLSRFLERHRVLVLGAYRDVELDRRHPLGEALASLRRERGFERFNLRGLERGEVSALLEAIAAHEVPDAFVSEIERETEGNPFFVREVLMHLLEEGKLARNADRFSATLSIEEMGIPEGVRQLIGQRLSRLSEAANQLLAAASGCGGAFRFDVVAAAAEIEERIALNALDEALGAQVVRPAGAAESYEFSHALFRHTLYTELNPSRQVRLHRRLAEETQHFAPERPFEIARHYSRSAVLPGAERGVEFAITAADRAETTGAAEEAAAALAIALELLPSGDARRARILARRGLVLSRTAHAEKAPAIALDAAHLLAESEGDAAAADYLADVASEIFFRSATPDRAWPLAERGLAFLGDRRDLTWAVLRGFALDRLDSEDPTNPGILVDTPERREIARLDSTLLPIRDPAEGLFGRLFWAGWAIPESRAAIVASMHSRSGAALGYWVGDFREALLIGQSRIAASLERGALHGAIGVLVSCARWHASLGDLVLAEQDLLQAGELADRAGTSRFLERLTGSARFELAYYRSDGVESVAADSQAIVARDEPALRWRRALEISITAVLFAFEGRDEGALRAVSGLIPAVERAGGGVINYTGVICRACEALWRIGRADFADVLERNLHAKTLAGDFRYPTVDARLALAQLCALTHRPEEARRWFTLARTALDEQGARPLRAIVDFDEAWMEIRRGAAGDRERARALLARACEQFREIGMPGWITRAEQLEALV